MQEGRGVAAAASLPFNLAEPIHLRAASPACEH